MKNDRDGHTHEEAQAKKNMPENASAPGTTQVLFCESKAKKNKPENTSAPGSPGGCAEGEVVLTVRALSGLSGDMLLGGLAALAGVGDAELGRMVAELHIPVPENCVRLETRSVNSAAGIGCRIDLPHEHAHRTFKDIAALIASSDMPEEAKTPALKSFTLLAAAEAAVHGCTQESVTFHEVGALDSIIDSCLCCRLFALLKPARFVCSPLPLADGCIPCAHGLLPSPAPAVLRMLEGISVRGFAGVGETVTPTALSLLKALHADFGPWPEMTVLKTAISYGTKVFPDAPNGALWALGRGIG
ncbi:MAG: LarC family nickel insertion protein [Desulfovibrio sp.]|nr:LarC family nickel insertion protein [Desulfovibrio sp.]